MAKRYLQTPTGTLPSTSTPSFPEIKETDVSRIGQNAMEGDNAIVDDFIVKPGGQVVVLGGDFELAGGLTLNIFKPLRAYRGTDGKEFAEMNASPSVVTLEPADPDNPRVDLVYVKLEEDQDGAQETRHFKLDPQDPDSAEGDLSTYTEKQNKLTVLVVTGTPASDPSVSETPSDGAPMYHIIVPAAATTLVGSNVIESRHNFWTLEEVDEIVADLINQINILKANKHRHWAEEIDVAQPAARAGANAQDVLNYLVTRADDRSTADPIFRPEIIANEPYTVLPYAQTSGKLGSAGFLDGGTPAVDVPIGREVSFFGGVSRKIEPKAFPASVESANINARIVNKHADQATQSRSNSIALTLSDIDNIESDGSGSWALKNAQLPFGLIANSFGRRSAARDARYLEIFGLNGGSNWYTYDSQADTITQRSFIGAVPTAEIHFAAPCGDGRILICASAAISGASWYIVNATTGVTAFVATGNPNTLAFPGALVFGDLIETNVIVLCDESQYVLNWWIFHVDSLTFERFTPLGQIPESAVYFIDLCFYQQGQGLILASNGPDAGTYIFDYSTRSMTRLNITQPFDFYGRQIVNNPRLANVNGRPQLFGEWVNTTIGGASLGVGSWELTPGSTPAWVSQNNQIPMRWFPSPGSLLSGGFPKGTGYMVGGQTPYRPAGNKDIWEFESGGIIETSCGGVTGLTLGPGTRTASFRVSSIALPWAVGSLLANLIGNYQPGSVQIAYSFDGGATRTPITIGNVTTIVGSPVNPTPLVYITLTGTAGQRPCVSRINELFEQSGGGAPGLTQVVLRFNVITTGVRYVYINRDGVVTIEPTAQMTTVDKALLMKVTPAGPSTQPTPFDYVNKRLIHRKYSSTRASGSTPSIANDFPVLPSFIRAFRVAADGSTMTSLADPAITFDSPIAATNMTTDGQVYQLELEA